MSKKLNVEICYVKENDYEPFIFRINGFATVEYLLDIEKTCKEDKECYFSKGDGDYLFNVNWFNGQHDGEGNCELRAGIELELISFNQKVDESGYVTEVRCG